MPSNNSIIPWTLPVNVETSTTIPRAEEWAWDFDNYEFAFNSAGQMYKVYEDEAIKVWIWKLFKTWRTMRFCIRQPTDPISGR